MICWKCKHEMPDGLKYCGHCGVRLNRVLHFLEWLFSKKGLPVLLVILALLLGGLALWLIPFVMNYGSTSSIVVPVF